MLKKSFPIHMDYYEELCNLTSEQRGDILLALINSAMDTDLPELDPVCALLFRLMRAQMDRITEANSNNSKGHGAPKGNQNAKKKTNETNGNGGNGGNEAETNKTNEAVVNQSATNETNEAEINEVGTNETNEVDVSEVKTNETNETNHPYPCPYPYPYPIP